jgi:hypothetical protein
LLRRLLLPEFTWLPRAWPRAGRWFGAFRLPRRRIAALALSLRAGLVASVLRLDGWRCGGVAGALARFGEQARAWRRVVRERGALCRGETGQHRGRARCLCEVVHGGGSAGLTAVRPAGARRAA